MATISAAPGGAWWRSAVTYQLYIRSFADGNGDGLGDIAGMRRRLPHLAALGVDAVWINPWYPSPQADGGASLRWLDLGPDVVAFTRGPGVVCAVNCWSTPIPLPPGEVALSSVTPGPGPARVLPPDTAVWLTT